MMRKKILQIVFIWLIIILSSQAQNNGRYKLTLSFDRVHNTNSNAMGWLDFEFFASSKGKEELLGKFQHGPVENSPWWGKQPPTIVKEYKNEDGKLVEVLEEGYYSLEEINNFLSSQSDEFVYISKDIEKLNDSLLEGSKNNDMVRAANVFKIYDSLEDVDCYNMKPQYLRKTEAERELENDKNK